MVDDQIVRVVPAPDVRLADGLDVEVEIYASYLHRAHAFQTGLLLGVLREHGLVAEMEFDAEGTTTDVLRVVLDLGGCTVRIRVLAARD